MTKTAIPEISIQLLRLIAPEISKIKSYRLLFVLVNIFFPLIIGKLLILVMIYLPDPGVVADCVVRIDEYDLNISEICSSDHAECWVKRDHG